MTTALNPVDKFVQEAEAFYATDEADRPKLFVPGNSIGLGNAIHFKFASEEEAFPKVDPGHTPMGNLVLVQIRQPKLRTAGGIEIPTEGRQTEQFNTQVVKVIALGPLCFRNRNDMTPWPEGSWAQVGDYVRVPKYQGDRFTVNYKRPDWEFDEKNRRVEVMVDDEVHFSFFKDNALIAMVHDPLVVKATH